MKFSAPVLLLPFSDAPLGTVFFCYSKLNKTVFPLVKIYPVPFENGRQCDSCGSHEWNAANGLNTIHVCPGKTIQAFTSIAGKHAREFDPDMPQAI